MIKVLALALPFFGIIFIGFLAGKLARLPRAGLAWLDFYLIYVALPALFFDILSRTPLEELMRGSFALATTTSTFLTFVIAVVVGVTVALQPVDQPCRELPTLVAIKLIVHPLMAWTMVTLVGGFPPIWVHTAVMMACLPPAATCYAAA